MMKNSAKTVWDKEYSDPVFTSFERKPHQVVKDFLKFLKKKEEMDLSGKVFLDVGCGIGKDVEYAIDHFDMQGMGCDVSPIAITEAGRCVPGGKFFVQDIGKKFLLDDATVDVAVMVMVIHTLSKSERELCLAEIARVLKPGGYFFLKTLAFEGDAHVKYLIKNMPGDEPNSFVHPDLKISEYVHTEKTLRADFAQDFEILSLEKTHGYQKWGNQSYKRNYWIAYAKLKA